MYKRNAEADYNQQCYEDGIYNPDENEIFFVALHWEICGKMTKKREDVLHWDDYFMGIALLAAQRSKDPSRQVGACIVNEEKKIIGVGYNGFPKNCSDDEFPWGKDKSLPKWETKFFYVCHAELNAILNAYGSTKGCRVYVTLFPCNECAKCIIQSGIQEIIYLTCKKPSAESDAVIKMFKSAKIEYRVAILTTELESVQRFNRDAFSQGKMTGNLFPVEKKLYSILKLREKRMMMELGTPKGFIRPGY